MDSLPYESREIVYNIPSAQGKHDHNSYEKKYGSGEVMGKKNSNNNKKFILKYYRINTEVYGCL